MIQTNHFITREIILISEDNLQRINFDSIANAAKFLGCLPNIVSTKAKRKTGRKRTKKGDPINMIKHHKTGIYYSVKYNESNVLKKYL